MTHTPMYKYLHYCSTQWEWFKLSKLSERLPGNGLSDDAPEVRNAALYALGQFAEHFQPDIVKYSNEVKQELGHLNCCLSQLVKIFNV